MRAPRRLRGVVVALLVPASVAFAAVVGVETDAHRAAEAARWQSAASMSQRRSYLAAAELDGHVYAAGGMVGETGRPLAVFQRFDPGRNSWTTLPRMPVAVRAAAGAALDGVFYVVGGSTRDGPTGDLYAYDVARRSWQARAPLPEPRLNHQAVALGGEIYVLGGLDGEAEESDDVFAYDPAADAWREAAPLPHPLHAFGVAAFRGEIWVIGGRRAGEILHEVWIYAPRRDRWRAGPPMPAPMELLGAAVAGDEIHAVWESRYQIYDAGMGEWRSGPRPLVTRHGLQAFVVSGRLYTVGGCTTQLRDSQVVEALDLA